MDADGGLWVSMGARIMYSHLSGANGSVHWKYPRANAGPTGELPRSQNRVRVETAPSDPNYVYACLIASNGWLDRVFKSTDKGQTWTVIGEHSSTFEPFMAFRRWIQRKFRSGSHGIWRWLWILPT